MRKKRVFIVWAISLLLPVTYAGTITLYPTQDAAVYHEGSGILENQNFGSSSLLMTTFGGQDDAGGYLQFDLSGIPAGATIDSAVLSIFHLSTAQPADTPLFLYHILSAWQEMTVTWESMPAGDGIPIAFAQMSGATVGTFLQFGVTGQVQAWLSGTPNFGFGVARDPMEPIIAWPDLVSREGAAECRPSLVVNYTEAIPEPGTFALLAVGLLGLGWRRYRR